VGSRMRVCLLGTGGAANEARHQSGVLVEWGEGARGGRILLDTGVGLDIVRLLIAAKSEPTEVRDIFVSHQHMGAASALEHHQDAGQAGVPTERRDACVRRPARS
jgi:glyoxylase-like metal-dependent hydrolase (beta-lactamase superfamily II)